MASIRLLSAGCGPSLSEHYWKKLSHEAPAGPREMTTVRLHQLKLVTSQGISAWSVTAFLCVTVSVPVCHLCQGVTTPIDLSFQPKKRKKNQNLVDL